MPLWRDVNTETLTASHLYGALDAGRASGHHQPGTYCLLGLEAGFVCPIVLNFADRNPIKDRDKGIILLYSHGITWKFFFLLPFVLLTEFQSCLSSCEILPKNL